MRVGGAGRRSVDCWEVRTKGSERPREVEWFKKRKKVQPSAWTHQEYYSPTLPALLLLYFFSLKAAALRRGSNLYCSASDGNCRPINFFLPGYKVLFSRTPRSGGTWATSAHCRTYRLSTIDVFRTRRAVGIKMSYFQIWLFQFEKL